MINLILHYLLALPDIVPSAPSDSVASVSAARKRKSLDLASMMASMGEATADPLLFNLVDLTLACLRSHSHQTILVTLQLVSVILKRHHRYAVTTLLYTEGVLDRSTYRTTGAHQQDVDYFMSLAGVIGGQDNFDEIYENALKDTQSRLENHPCSIKLVTPKTSINNHKLPAIPDSLPGAPRDVRSHTLRPDDPLLNIILDHLETFFLNPVETNLSLTEVIFNLGVCGFMHLEGWFLRHPNGYLYDEDDDSPPLSEPPLDPDSPEYAEHRRAQSLQKCRRRPKWTSANLPRLLRILQTLCDQIVAYREIIPRFDDLLQQRREAFQIADSAATPMPIRTKSVTPAQPSTLLTSPPIEHNAPREPSTRNSSRERFSGGLGFAQRILSELGTPSRSGSPRGRKESVRSASDRSMPGAFFSPRGSAGDLSAQETPKRVPSAQSTVAAAPRSFSPSSTASTTLGSVSGPPWENRTSHHPIDGAFFTQAKAFQAVDQSILAREVGLPVIAQSTLGETRDREKQGHRAEDPTQPISFIGDYAGQKRVQGVDQPLLAATATTAASGTQSTGGEEEADAPQETETKSSGDSDGQSQSDLVCATPPSPDDTGTDDASGVRAASDEQAVGSDPAERAIRPAAAETELSPATFESGGLPTTPATAEAAEEGEQQRQEGEVSEYNDRPEEEYGEEEEEEGEEEGEQEEQEEKKVSVSHVLTNAIVLQNFLFELASVVQVRAGLFEEVRFV